MSGVVDAVGRRGRLRTPYFLGRLPPIDLASRAADAVGAPQRHRMLTIAGSHTNRSPKLDRARRVIHADTTGRAHESRPSR